MKAGASVLSLLASCAVAAQACAETPRDIYLLLGQSNMAGRGSLVDAPKISTDRVYKFGTNDTWEVATPPVHWDGGRGGFGPGLSFGRAMADAKPGVMVGLVPCAVGGSSLSRWMPPNGPHYTNMLAKARLALSAGGVLRGVIWHQGEADSWNERTAGSYGKRIGILIRALRKEFGDPGLPFVGGEVAPFYSVSIAKKGGTSFVAVVNAQERATLATLPSTGFVTVEGLRHGDGGDIVHFEPKSATELGRRYATEMLRVQKEAESHE